MTTSHESLTGKNRSTSPFLSVSSAPNSMSRSVEDAPRVLPVMTRMPHFADEVDPSILPIRQESQPTEIVADETDSSDEVTNLSISRQWESVREQSGALLTRLFSDKLLLSSWICVVLLSGMTLVNHFRIEKQTTPTDVSEWILRGANEATSAVVATEITLPQEPVTNPFSIDETTASFAAATSNEVAPSASLSPWERPVTNNYSPWNPTFSESPTTPPYAQAVRVEDYVTAPQNAIPANTLPASSTLPQTISPQTMQSPRQDTLYEPVGFAGYDVTSFGASETQQLAMRPAVPITPPQNFSQQNVPPQNVAQNGAQNYAVPQNFSQQNVPQNVGQNYAVPQNRTPYAAQPNYQPALPYSLPSGQIPVAATSQTFRNEVVPQHDPRFASPAMNLVEQGNYQAASSPYYGGHAPAPTMQPQQTPTGMNGAPQTQYPQNQYLQNQQQSQYPQHSQNTMPQNPPQFSIPPAYYQYPAAHPAVSSSSSVIK